MGKQITLYDEKTMLLDINIHFVKLSLHCEMNAGYAVEQIAKGQCLSHHYGNTQNPIKR